MIDVELAIKIPNEIYQNIIKNRFLYDEDSEVVSHAIINGVLLPKGHGSLKDVDNIKTAFPNGELVRTESVKATVDYEETIIEADKKEARQGFMI